MPLRNKTLLTAKRVCVLLGADAGERSAHVHTVERALASHAARSVNNVLDADLVILLYPLADTDFEIIENCVELETPCYTLMRSDEPYRFWDAYPDGFHDSPLGRIFHTLQTLLGYLDALAMIDEQQAVLA